MQRANSAPTESSAAKTAPSATPSPASGKPVIAGVDGAEGMPPDEKLAALRRVQAQAEQRIRLGMQLFKAAEAHVSGQQNIVEDLRHAQEQLRDDLHSDVARSFRSYDEWMGEFGDQIGDRMEKMEGRIEQLQHRWGEIEKRIGMMVKRAEALVEQSRSLLESGVAHVAKRDMAAAKQQCLPAPPPATQAAPSATANTQAAEPAQPAPSTARQFVTPASPAPASTNPAPAQPTPTAAPPATATPTDMPADTPMKAATDAPPTSQAAEPAEPVFLKVIDKIRQQQTPAADKSESADADDGSGRTDDANSSG